jgi:hypothetical protein
MVRMAAESGMAAELGGGGVTDGKVSENDCSTYLFPLCYPHAYVDFSMS